MRKGKRRIIGVLIGSLVLGSVTPAWAQSSTDSSLELFSSGEETEDFGDFTSDAASNLVDMIPAESDAELTGETTGSESELTEATVGSDVESSDEIVADAEAADESLLAEEIASGMDTAATEETIADVDTATTEERIADADTAAMEETIDDAAATEETISDTDTAATEETTADADGAVSEEIISNADEAVADIADTGSISVNATEVTIYALDPMYAEEISIPEEYPTSFQIVVSGAEGTPTFTSSTVSPKYLDVDENGLVTPVLCTSYTGSKTIQAYTYGDFTVYVRADGITIPVTVHVEKYSAIYAENKMDTFLAENITDSMSNLEKVETIAQWIANTTDYSSEYSGYIGLMIFGEGDCLATKNAVNYMCNKIGIRAMSRYAADEPGAGSGHQNSLVVIDGEPYVVDCGYVGSAPRYYRVEKITQLFDYETLNDGTLKITRYQGIDAEVEIPSEIDGKTVTVIGESIFDHSNVSVTSVILPETVTTIENGAFASEEMETLYIPAGVTCLSKEMFCYVSGSFEVSDDNSAYTCVDGVIYSKDKTILVAVPTGLSGKFSVPEGVTEIAEYAFFGCDSLTEILLSSSVCTIGAKAFYSCDNLQAVKLNDGLKTIGDEAFNFCTSLDCLDVPSSVKILGQELFYRGPEKIRLWGTETSFDSSTFRHHRDSKNVNYLYCMVAGLSGSAAESYASEYGYPYANMESNGKVVLMDEWFQDILKKYPDGDPYTAVYSGKAYTPEVKLADDAPSLVLDTDYQITYQNNQDAGTATVVISALGDFYQGTVTKNFTITKKSLSYTSPVFTESGKTTVSVYSDGAPAEPEITIDGLTEGKDYTVTYSGNAEAGQAKAVITGIGNYQGTRTRTFYVYATITGIKAIADQTYTGQYLTPEFEVECALDAAGHYSTRWTNNRDAGTATVTVTGTGYYQGSVSATFKIAARDLASSDITVFMVLTNNSAVYTGNAITPYVYANRSMNGNKFSLYKGTDFTVSYENNVNVGTATVTVNGIGNYCGSRTMTFTITAPTPTPTRTVSQSTSGGTTGGNTGSGSTTNGTTGSGSTADGNTGSGSTADGNTGSGSTADGNTTSGTTTGGSATTGSTTSGTTNGKTTGRVIWNDEDGSDDLDGETDESRSKTDADETETGGTSETEEETVSSSLKKTTLKSVKSKKTKQLTVSWKKVSGAQKYQIQICQKKNFKSGVKTKIVNGKKTSYTVKKLKKKTTYYVRIRVMKKVNGRWTYGAWSKTKKVKTK